MSQKLNELFGEGWYNHLSPFFKNEKFIKLQKNINGPEFKIKWYE